jgi:hypothetical protein
MKGSHDTLQEGMVPPEGGTTSVLQADNRKNPIHNPWAIRCIGVPRGRSLDTTKLDIHEHAPLRSRSHHRRLTKVTDTRPAR